MAGTVTDGWRVEVEGTAIRGANVASTTNAEAGAEKEGIMHEVTPPYSPESNGVVEIKNRTLKEMMNSLLVSASTPNNLIVVNNGFSKQKVLSHMKERQEPLLDLYTKT